MSFLSPERRKWLFARIILIAIGVALFALGHDLFGWIVFGIWGVLLVYDLRARRRV